MRTGVGFGVRAKGLGNGGQRITPSQQGTYLQSTLRQATAKK